MMSRHDLFSILFFFAATSLLLTACGDETLQCGPGTSEKSGECVAETPHIPASTECGPGTELDADNNQCVATQTAEEILCGNGTEIDSTGKFCNPIPGPTPIECGEGTTLENDICIPNINCTDDQTAVNGFCLSPAEALANSADARNIDEPFVLELPIETDHFIFTGTIGEPAEIDDKLVQDTDSFTFEGQAGQWFEITLQSLGLPAPAFKIEAINEDPDNNDFIYERFSPFGSDAVARHVMLPVDATYKVTILPERAITHAGPFGADSWKYVGTVKQTEVLDASNIELVNHTPTPQELSGAFTVLPLNLYEFQTEDDADVINLTVEHTGSDVRGSILVFSDLHTLTHTFDDIQPGQTIEIPNTDDTTFVLVDWIQADGPAQNYNIHARSQGQRIPLDLQAGTSVDLNGFTAPENTIIKLSLKGDSPDPIDLSIFDESEELLGKTRNVKSQGVSRQRFSYAFYASGGDFSIQAENNGTQVHQNDLIIEFIKPTELDPLPPNERTEISPFLSAHTSHFFLFESIDQHELLHLTQTNEHDFFENDVLISVHTANGEIPIDDFLIVNLQDAGGWFDHELFYYAKNNTEPLLIQIRNANDADFHDFTLHMDSITPDLLESADPNGFKNEENITYNYTEDMDAGTNKWLRIIVAEPIEMTALLTALPPGDVDFYAYRTNLVPFAFSEYFGDESFDIRITPGEYLFKIIAYTDTPGGFTFSATTEPDFLNLTGTDDNASFADAQEITQLPARINGTANQSLDGRHQYWAFTATDDTTISLDMTYLGGPFAMHVITYEQDQSTIHARTTEPLGRDTSIDNMRANLSFPVINGQTYFLRVGGESPDPNGRDFRYTIKITDTHP